MTFSERGHFVKPIVARSGRLRLKFACGFGSKGVNSGWKVVEKPHLCDRTGIQGWPHPQSNSRRSVESKPMLTFSPGSSSGFEISNPASKAATIRAPLDICCPAQFSITCLTQKLLNFGGLETVALLSHWRQRSICF